MKSIFTILTLAMITIFQNTAAASSSRLASLANVAAKQQQLLYRSARTGARIGKSSLLQPKSALNYSPVRNLNISAAPNLLNRAQGSLANMTSGFFNRISTFWNRPATTVQPITLTAIRSEIHASHEQDKQGRPILPNSTKEKIKFALSDPIQAQELLQELTQELSSLKEQLDDLKEQQSWYQEHGAQKLWQTKLSLLEKEYSQLELIEQFIESQQE